MPRFLSSVPTFLVSDVAQTAKWYEDTLGFRASSFPKQAPYVYASLQSDGAEIMLLRQEGYRKSQVQREGGAWDAYIRVKDVQVLYEEVRQRIPVKSELTTRPYGDTEFEVVDPNGYVLVFGG
jgi:uncharacterized glyoxalase superfamily protein PhnB